MQKDRNEEIKKGRKEGRREGGQTASWVRGIGQIGAILVLGWGPLSSPKA
jgi:hypothetical protein